MRSKMARLNPMACTEVTADIGTCREVLVAFGPLAGAGNDEE